MSLILDRLKGTLSYRCSNSEKSYCKQVQILYGKKVKSKKYHKYPILWTITMCLSTLQSGVWIPLPCLYGSQHCIHLSSLCHTIPPLQFFFSHFLTTLPLVCPPLPLSSFHYPHHSSPHSLFLTPLIPLMQHLNPLNSQLCLHSSSPDLLSPLHFPTATHHPKSPTLQILEQAHFYISIYTIQYQYQYIYCGRAMPHQGEGRILNQAG